MPRSPDFAAGFVARHDPKAQAQLALIAHDPFAPADLKARATRGRKSAAAGVEGDAPTPRSFSPQPVGPRHFSPEPAIDEEQAADTAPDAADFVDPIEQARAQGFADGVAHGRALAEAQADRDAALIAQLGAALSSPDRIDRDALARHMRDTVLMLVTRMVGDVGVAADVLAARVEAATALLADSAESAVLRLHPDDVALVKDRLPPTIFTTGDATLERGNFVLEGAATLVEDGPELWLAQLAAAIERVPLPLCAAQTPPPSC
ncbi:MAG: flagellar biosynthesis protein FliH [Sphingomonas sp.]|uniref:FliH/SctL family protein n=1 Tax=Sphingomonas sp. TaxID=28214 RepID=UPI001852B829|nr:flagellar biosynthesis protein FliH [Sphingomonas sp.]